MYRTINRQNYYLVLVERGICVLILDAVKVERIWKWSKLKRKQEKNKQTQKALALQ